MEPRVAKFGLGQVVRHRVFPFRGVVYDVDPEFADQESWWSAIPEASRPSRDQPFYRLLADNGQSCYVAYVSEQNLVPDAAAGPVEHPGADTLFAGFCDGAYQLKGRLGH